MTEKIKHILPELSQVGIIVRDLETSIKCYSEIFGINFTNTILNLDKHWVRDKLFPVELKVALAQLGPIQLELIEPISDGPHKWFLDNKGGGLHHLGFNITDYDKTVALLKSVGLELLMNVEADIPTRGYHIRSANLESEKCGNVIFEVTEKKPIGKIEEKNPLKRSL